MEYFQVFLNEDFVAGDQETAEGRLVQILQHPLLLLLQPPLRLLHVLRHWVLPEELGRLPHVEALSVLQELIFKTLFVNRQVLASCSGILLIEAEFDIAVLDGADKPLVDGLSFPLLLNELEHCVSDGLVEVPEEVVPPGDEGQLVDLVYSLPALLALPAHPVPVEVGAHPVEDLGAELILLPLGRVELQYRLVH